MAIYTEEYLRERTRQKIGSSRFYSSGFDTAVRFLLNESDVNFSDTNHYDIFLSHSYLDKELVLGVKIELERYGYSVYVDWVEDSQLNRKMVTPQNVILIKKRMQTSTSLLYVTSDHSTDSKWMPWELGYMDGYRSKVALFPISENGANNYRGTEYLGTYPYIDRMKSNNSANEMLWVTDQNNSKLYVSFDSWIKGSPLRIRE